jgi:hypothetical protein
MISSPIDPQSPTKTDQQNHHSPSPEKLQKAQMKIGS